MQLTIVRMRIMKLVRMVKSIQNCRGLNTKVTERKNHGVFTLRIIGVYWKLLRLIPIVQQL